MAGEYEAINNCRCLALKIKNDNVKQLCIVINSSSSITTIIFRNLFVLLFNSGIFDIRVEG